MNTMTKEVDGRKIKVSAEYIGDKAANWTVNGQQNYHNNKVTIRCGGRSLSFDFWGSIMNPECRSDSDLRHAAYCAVSDARMGEMEFEDFCKELGLSVDSLQAHNSWKACKAMKRKIDRVLTVEEQDEILMNFG